MAMFMAAFLLCGGFLCTNSQFIFPKENNLCAINGETMMRIRDLLIQQRRIQESVDSLRRIVKTLEEDVTNTHEDFQIVKRSLKSKDCREYYENGHKESGGYLIYPFGNKSQVHVYCDMKTQGGGWTAIQKRSIGSVSFYKTWAQYRKGFGSSTDSYWIGNDVIHKLTKGRNSFLYVSITLRNGTTLYELYHQFSVSDEADNYRLFLGGPATGKLGDRMLDTGSYNTVLSGMSFSTRDRDNDRHSGRNCASYYQGGWWFNACHSAFLNGLWSSDDRYRRPSMFPWYPTVTNGKEIKETLMMIRPH